MRSVKPGRGQSLFGAIGGIIAIAFGFFWMNSAASMGAPPDFVAFGWLFILAAVAGVAYNLYNATAENRTSIVDLTAHGEEPDPIGELLGHEEHLPRAESNRQAARLVREDDAPRRVDGDYCPYCGAKVESDFDFCPKCGEDI